MINATKDLAGGVLYDQLTSWFAASPFFKSKFNTNKTAKTLFKNNIDVLTGSRSSQFLGRAIVSAVLSEINFQNKVANQAYDNYNVVKTRLQSRFMSQRASYPGRMWIDSSKAESSSFIDEVVIKGRDNDPQLLVFDNPIWEVKKHLGIYSGKTFKVFIGDETRDPVILDKNSLNYYPEDKVIDVPIEYEMNFRSDLHGSIKDLAGKAIQSAYKFLPSIEKINESLIRKNPVNKEIIVLDFNDRHEQLIDYLDSRFFREITPEDRFIHIDIGLKKDKLALSSGKLLRILNVDGVNVPVYYVDFIMCISPKPSQEIPLYKIKNFIMDLKYRGYPIKKVTMDGFQSENLKQDLILNGIESEILSVDRTFAPYIELKSAIMEARLNCIDHPILKEELTKIEKHEKKIDHPIAGSKDMADALCGMVFSIKKSIEDILHNSNNELEKFNEVLNYFDNEEKSFYEKILTGTMI
jgi:hypothetical protein